jgi:hypothetical protein
LNKRLSLLVAGSLAEIGIREEFYCWWIDGEAAAFRFI